MKKNLYQFNLDFQRHYIQGHFISENEVFFEIEPTYISIVNHQIKPSDNLIYLSKKSIVCYFKIKE